LGGAVVDIFRVDTEKLGEYWDVKQLVPLKAEK
jgi:predicted SnoaL-like aldol condensation-catalyzing enzyme